MYKAKELLDAGCTLKQLSDGGYLLFRFYELGYTKEDLKAAGINT
ncbi:MAG: hypothetical protein ACQKHC_01845 [Candidatus Phytoplasma pruni]